MSVHARAYGVARNRWSVALWRNRAFASAGVDLHLAGRGFALWVEW